jgi:hypothetical protein
MVSGAYTPKFSHVIYFGRTKMKRIFMSSGRIVDNPAITFRQRAPLRTELVVLSAWNYLQTFCGKLQILRGGVILPTY